MSIKPIPDDYQPKDGTQFKEFQDGSYIVKGIKWNSLSDSGSPILVKQKNGLVGRFNFVLENGSEGPFNSVDLFSMILLVTAFGGDISELPPIPNETDAGAVSNYMNLVQSLINKSYDTTEVVVKDKWVNYVKGMELPNGKYQFRIAKVTSRNDQDEPSWYVQKWPSGGISRRIKLLLEIVAGENGHPTPFRGVSVQLQFDYGFKYDDTVDVIDWEKDDEGEGWSISAKNASKLYTLTAPQMFDNFNPPSKYNIVPYWWSFKPHEKVLTTHIRVKESSSGYRYYVIDILGLELVGDFNPDQSSQNAQPQIKEDWEKIADGDEDQDLTDKAIVLFVKVMNHLAGEEAVQGDEFTKAGIKAAKEYLTPLKNEGKIPAKAIKNFTYKDITSVFRGLVDTVKDEKREQVLVLQEQLELALIGLDETVTVGEAKDCPF